MSSNDIKKLKPTKVTLLFKQYAQKLSFQCAINMKVMNEMFYSSIHTTSLKSAVYFKCTVHLN